MSKNLQNGNKNKMLVNNEQEQIIETSEVLNLWDFVTANLNIKKSVIKQLKGSKYEEAIINLEMLEEDLVNSIKIKDAAQILRAVEGILKNTSVLISHKSIGMSANMDGIISILNDYLAIKELPLLRLTEKDGEYSIRTKSVTNINDLAKKAGLNLSHVDVGIGTGDGDFETLVEFPKDKIETEKIIVDNISDVTEDTDNPGGVKSGIKESNIMSEIDIAELRKSLMENCGDIFKDEEELFLIDESLMAEIINIPKHITSIRDMCKPLLESVDAIDKFSVNLYIENMERMIDRLINSTVEDYVRVFEENIKCIPAMAIMLGLLDGDPILDFTKSMLQLFIGVRFPEVFIIANPKSGETTKVQEVEVGIETSNDKEVQNNKSLTPASESSKTSSTVIDDEEKLDVAGMWSVMSNGRFDKIRKFKC